MIRSFQAVSALVFVAAAVSSCNTPVCGKGTKQVQLANGNVECQPADHVATTNEPCDVDGGTAEIVGGVCVSRIKCDPDSAMYDPATGVCVGTGGGPGCSAKCGTVGANQVCVKGNVYDFASGMKLAPGGRPLRIGVYEPLSFLANPASAPLAETAATTDACFALVVAAPASGLVAVAVQDPVTGPGTNAPLAIGGAGSPVVKGQTYQVDGYLVTKQLMMDWATEGGNDYPGKGAYVGCYFKDPGQPPTMLTATETMPAMGVKILSNGTTPATAKYLNTSRHIDPALGATGALGCAVLLGDSMIGTLSGTGGGVTKWEAQPGASTTGVVFVSRFHNCDVSTGDPNCQ